MPLPVQGLKFACNCFTGLLGKVRFSIVEGDIDQGAKCKELVVLRLAIVAAGGGNNGKQQNGRQPNKGHAVACSCASMASSNWPAMSAL